MGLFSWLCHGVPQNFGAQLAPVSSGHSFFFGGTSSGRSVNERTAMQMTAVYSCVRILAESVAGSVIDYEAENARLRAENLELRRVNELIKEASAFFSSELAPMPGNDRVH